MKTLSKHDLDLIYRTIYTTLECASNDPNCDWDGFEDNVPACEMVLAMYYWNLYPVNKKLLKICLSTKSDQWDKFYSYCADIWEKHAIEEINTVIKEIENEPIT